VEVTRASNEGSSATSEQPGISGDPPLSATPSREDRLLAAAGYLGYFTGFWLVVPIVIYILKREKSRFVGSLRARGDPRRSGPHRPAVAARPLGRELSGPGHDCGGGGGSPAFLTTLSG
jgi:hypothetical protein